MEIIRYEPKYRDDLIFMVLAAKDAIGRVPTLNADLQRIKDVLPETRIYFSLRGSNAKGIVNTVSVFNKINCIERKIII